MYFLGRTKNSRLDEGSLVSPVGAAGVKWLEGRTCLAPTHDRGAYGDSHATDTHKSLSAAVIYSPGARSVFGWSRAEREDTGAPGTMAQRDVDRVSSHALGYVTSRLPAGFNDEELVFDLE